MHPNYTYLLQFLHQFPGAVCLDYGCGRGEVVVAGRAQGLDLYGVEAFYQGSDALATVEAAGLLNTAIYGLRGDVIPFPDAFFDVIVSNQVLEHVSELDAVCAEIARVLKPGGMTLHLFPDAGMFREGHNGIPFVHWLPRGRLRHTYAVLCRALGMGYVKADLPWGQWARERLAWMDTYCYYRPRGEILATFGKHFATVELREETWLAHRLQQAGYGSWACWVPDAVVRGVVRRLAGLVVWARR